MPKIHYRVPGSIRTACGRAITMIGDTRGIKEFTGEKDAVTCSVCRQKMIVPSVYRPRRDPRLARGADGCESLSELLRF